MKKHVITLVSILLLIILAGALLTACGSSTQTSPSSGNSSGGASNGQVLLQTRCTVCHSLDRITSSQKTADQWKTTVDRMINNGAQLTPQEEQTLITYLAQTYK